MPFEDVEVVLVLRRQDGYLESLYNEHVKATRYSSDIWRFLKDYWTRFEYKQQMELWAKYFPALKTSTFEDLVRSRNVTAAFLEVVCGARDVVFEEFSEESNASLPVDLVEFKRLLNRSPLSRAELKDVVSILERVAVDRVDDNSARLSRLSVDDRREILAKFADDKEWINREYFGARPQGLFPSEIREVSVLEPLDVRSVVDVAAEIIRLQMLPLEK